MKDYVLSAFLAIWSNKARSLLTVLGVVIGVASVTTLVSLGQGLKNDVSNLIRGFGTNVVVAVPGKIDPKSGQFSQNPANFIATDILTLKDWQDISALPEIEESSPLGLVSGNIKVGDKVASPTIFGAFPNVLRAFGILQVEKGSVFETKASGNVIVLGGNVANALFGDENPVGKKVTLGKEEFTVVGAFKQSKSTGVSGVFTSELDNISMIPFDTATKLNKDQVKIVRIVSKAKDDADVVKTKDKIHQLLLENHAGEENFTVLTQDDILGLFNQFLNLATTLVSAIAAISLVVGGIGIMNIMLVVVTERTREIGLRKAVGATRRAILIQFLTEAVIITFVGGLLGLAISFLAGAVVAAKTELTPAITLNVILIAAGISAAVGITFGLWPALRAARKDPIEALRYE